MNRLHQNIHRNAYVTGKPESGGSPEHPSLDNSFTQSSPEHEHYMCRQVSNNSSEEKIDGNHEQSRLSSAGNFRAPAQPAPSPPRNDILSLSFSDSLEDNDRWCNDNRLSIFRMKSYDVAENGNMASKSKGLKSSFDSFDGELTSDLPTVGFLGENNEDIGFTDYVCDEETNAKFVGRASKQEKDNGLVAVPPKKKISYSDIVSTLLSKEQAFSGFSFLVSPLKERMHMNPNRLDIKSYETNFHTYYMDRENLLIAKRRLKSAVLAFGGNYGSMNGNNNKNDSAPRDGKKQKLGTYEETLAYRYYENCGRISWDVEESPFDATKKSMDDTDSSSFNSYIEEEALHLQTKNGSDRNQFLDEIDNSESSSMSEEDDSGKTKYRCKLCGKPKHNHVCSYQQALERSIGTMAYPCLNAFECKEPGRLAPALSEMNNFTDLIDVEKEDTDTRLQSTYIGLSSEATSSVLKNPTTSNWKRSDAHDENYDRCVGSKRKLYLSPNNEKFNFARDELFLQKTSIRIEQHRTVTDISQDETDTENRYPTIPLTMAQRTSMSKFLFDLCQQVNGLTEICTDVLSNARETESWDLVVAELITQSLVIIHCPPEDQKLDGLRDFLLTIGIST